MPSLELSLKRGGYVWIKVKAKGSKSFLQTLEKLKKIPVIKFDKKAKKNVTSIYYLDQIYEICRHYGWEVFVTDTLDLYHDYFKTRLLALQKARDNKEFSSALWTDNPECKVDPHQAQAANIAFTAKRWLIGDDMGVGKTPELLAVFCMAFDADYQKGLICVLNRLKYQWKSEILKFTKFKEEDIAVIDPSAKFVCPLKLTKTLNLRSLPCKACERKDKCFKERADPLKRLKGQLKDCKIAIVNYESLRRIKEMIIKLGFDIFGFDEASKLKNANSEMAKSAKYIGSNCSSTSIIVLMSGTFIENAGYDIFSSFRVIDQRIFGEWYNFKNKFLVLDYWNNIIGIKNRKLLKEIVDNHIIRRKISEVWLDRPPLIEHTIMCEMEDEQADFYKRALEGKLEKLSDTENQRKINMADIGPLLNYLLQIADTPETMEPKMKNHSCKLDTLKELLEFEIGPNHKVLIFNFFGNKVVPIIEREVKNLKIGKTLVITGKVKVNEAEARKKLFKENPKYRFLICSDANSYGANLQEATVVINFGLRWNPATLNQRIARAYRRGQKNKVVVYNLVTAGTIEEKVLETLGTKRKLFDDLLGGVSQKKGLSLQQMVDMLRAK